MKILPSGSPVGKHHMKVADGMLLVLGVSSGVGKHQHGIVINAVIITGGFLCELTVGIAVNPLYQVNTRAFRQLLSLKSTPHFASEEAIAQRWLGVWKPPSSRPYAPSCTISPPSVKISSCSVRFPKLLQILIHRDKETTQKAVSGAEKKLQVT